MTPAEVLRQARTDAGLSVRALADAAGAGLAEWLAVRAGRPAPAWVHDADRYLHRQSLVNV